MLKNFGVFPERKWFWMGVAALSGFTALYNVLFTLALMYLNRKFYFYGSKDKLGIFHLIGQLMLGTTGNSPWEASS